MTSVRLSSDAKSVLTGSVDRTLKLWDVSRNTYKQLLTLNHDSAVYCVDMTSDSFTAVSGHLDGGLRCWDTRLVVCCCVAVTFCDLLVFVSALPWVYLFFF